LSGFGVSISNDNVMLKNEFHISKLLAGHFSNQANQQEQDELDQWINASSDNKTYFDHLNHQQAIQEKFTEFQILKSTHKEEIWNKIAGNLDDSFPLSHATAQHSVGKNWLHIAINKTGWWAVAAVLLITISTVVWTYTNINNSKELLLAYANDVPAGKTSATLTLANGKKIALSTTTNGQLAKEAGVNISKTSDGKLVYSVVSSSSIQSTEQEQSYNTLSTANGEQYQVILPDKSIIWLNAASSITYPTTFGNSKKREITAKGEIYFEIAKDKKHPFIVKTGTQTIQVLGTHFNVNSYDDEPEVKTTLIEGSVKVSSLRGAGDEEAILKPGQQSINNGSKITVQPVNIDEVIAWKEGYFRFSEEPLESLMRKISRWYNVKVVYASDVPKDITLDGVVSRNKSISAVLESITLTENVKFKVSGQTITVLKFK
jgi:transmembrane sensor